MILSCSLERDLGGSEATSPAAAAAIAISAATFIAGDMFCGGPCRRSGSVRYKPFHRVLGGHYKYCMVYCASGRESSVAKKNYSINFCT
eukprot:464093-Hanusia_phi.AAC.1